MSQPSSATPISRADVEHIAALAALALTPEELDRFGKDLGSILEYVAELDELDTAGIEPLTQISQLLPTRSDQVKSALRADEPRPSLARELVMADAPATDGVFFKVPKVIER